MARRTFTMVDVTEILQHWYAGRPKVEVARSLGVDAKTVRRYVAPAEAAGMAPGGPPVSEEQWRALARQRVPPGGGTGVRQGGWGPRPGPPGPDARPGRGGPAAVVRPPAAAEQGPAGQRGAVAGAGPAMVPASSRHGDTAGVLAPDRGAP